jgi:gliding motility associated protien GldN
MAKRLFFVSLFSVATFFAMGQAEVESSEVTQAYQEEMEEQYNPNSINPIPKYEHHYKRRVWRTIDLTEKQNKGFFSNNGEITKLIVDGVKSGEIADIYASDSLTTKISKEQFLGRLVQTQGMQYEQWDPTRNWYTDEIASYNGRNYRVLVDNVGKNPEISPDEWAVTSEGKAIDYLPRDMNILRLVEDVIFDKRRSRLYYDLLAIQIIVPGSKTTTQVDEELGWFRYKDLERVFRNHPKTAVWFNRYNTAQNKNFADAFLLRLFHGRIRKIENPDDETIFEIYQANGRSHREAVWATEWAELELMEKEHNLWEF